MGCQQVIPQIPEEDFFEWRDDLRGTATPPRHFSQNPHGRSSPGRTGPSREYKTPGRKGSRSSLEVSAQQTTAATSSRRDQGETVARSSRRDSHPQPDRQSDILSECEDLDSDDTKEVGRISDAVESCLYLAPFAVQRVPSEEDNFAPDTAPGLHSELGHLSARRAQRANAVGRTLREAVQTDSAGRDEEQADDGEKQECNKVRVDTTGTQR